MGAQNSTSGKALSPRTLKRQLSEFVNSEFILTTEQESVVKSPDLYDNEGSSIVVEDEELGKRVDHTPLSPNALSWLTETTPSTQTPINCDADAYNILTPSIHLSLHFDDANDIFSGKEDSMTISEVSISRGPSSPEPELQLSLSPRSDVGDGFFPPTPRGGNTPRSRTGTINTPTEVRRLSATQNMDLDLQDSPKGVRLSRRGGMCAFLEHQVPESIRSIRTQELFESGGEPCPEEGRPATHQRAYSARFNWTPHTVESISSEVISPPHRCLRRSRTDYLRSSRKRNASREIGGNRLPF